MSAEIQQIVAEMDELRNDLRDQLGRIDDAKVAAALGNRLLEANEQLSVQLEATTNNLMNIIEVLKQEKHSLTLKLEQKVWAERACLDEIENLRILYKEEKQKVEKLSVFEKQSLRIDELKAQVELLEQNLTQSEMDRKYLSEQNSAITKQLQAKWDAEIYEMKERDNELATLNDEVNRLTAEKMNLSETLRERDVELQQLLHQITSLRHKTEHNKELMEEYECQIIDYNRSLDLARQMNMELREELTLLKVGAPDVEKKGNSLFAEVEDRRIEAEKKLISMEVLCENQKQQLENMRQQLRSLKGQIAGLLITAGGRGAEDHLARIELQLADALNDRQVLATRLAEYERREKAAQMVNESSSSDYWKTLLDSKERELIHLREELRTKRLLLLTEKDSNIQYERQLYNKDSEISQLKGTIIKLQIRLDDLVFKYEPEKASKKHNSKGDRQKKQQERLSLSSKKHQDNVDNYVKENLGNCLSLLTANTLNSIPKDADNILLNEKVNGSNNIAKENVDGSNSSSSLLPQKTNERLPYSTTVDKDKLPDCKMQ